MKTGSPTSADFIKAIYSKAKEVSQKTGIALELILAQAAVETGWGRSIKGNNLFGIKADKNWTGKTVEFTTKEYINGEWVTKVDKFRAYDSWEESIEDYAKFLMSQPRYRDLLLPENLNNFDRQVKELVKAGYATNPRYEKLLRDAATGKTMRKALYEVGYFDSENRNLNNLLPNNQYYIVQPGDTLSKIAKRYGVDLNDLINENRRRGLIEDPNLIYPGQRIYIPGYQEKTRRNVQEGSRRIDPLVIDLDGDGIKLVNINKSDAMFDLTGSGFANKTGWISSEDAFLVRSKVPHLIFAFN